MKEWIKKYQIIVILVLIIVVMGILKMKYGYKGEANTIKMEEAKDSN